MSSGNTSPTSSWVVTSSTAENTPSSTSCSMAVPPAPEAWNATGSYPAWYSQPTRALTAPWVFPRAVRATAGRPPGISTGACIAPRSMAAALANTAPVMRLGPPKKSATENMIAMSLACRYGRRFPEATVDTTTLGTDRGRLRRAMHAAAVPWFPPIPTAPARYPSRHQRRSS